MKAQILFFLALGIFISACGPLNNTGYSSGSSYDPYPSYGYGGYDRYDYERERMRDERRDLEKDRNRLEKERRRLEEERLERERERQREQANRRPPERRESCPAGFHPSEQKCSKEERRRGCQDMRMPGGLGCVRR